MAMHLPLSPLPFLLLTYCSIDSSLILSLTFLTHNKPNDLTINLGVNLGFHRRKANQLYLKIASCPNNG